MNTSPSSRATVIVVGSGGFATEIIDYLRAGAACGGGPELLGVACDHVAAPAPEVFRGLPFLGGLQAAMERYPEARFVVSMGSPRYREERTGAILKAGRALYTVIHPSAVISPDAQIGPGSVIAPFTVVNAAARIGTSCVLNVFCSVGHGARLGDYSVLSPYAAINGNGETGRGCFLGTRATIYPRVRIGDRCQIDTHSYAKADVGDHMIVSVRGEYRVLKNRLEKDP